MVSLVLLCVGILCLWKGIEAGVVAGRLGVLSFDEALVSLALCGVGVIALIATTMLIYTTYIMKCM